ncbi:peptide/nickel transport system substrate-binding protein [Pelomonas aquatica]|uniref:Peptide/nickel transport system substrate-binding protein n=1 Tax=Pelomonas aquatica TaxID=431058 RepID=A0ABU1ZEJ7_9BURK|nr:ABC transporter substrate-binding protein [Pelomonas aquatica]MDR7299054.1 peptide/nickel transport system substrate-binding protein [Pelomonas aquatica]
MFLASQRPLRRRPLLALPALLAAGWGTAHAGSPDDQLLIGMSMNNLLSLDPAAATGLDAATVACNLYDSLLEVEAADATRLRPSLAQSWSVGEGGRRITLNLRADVRFASGRPLTAAHAAWSLHRVLKLNLALASVWKSYGFTAANAATHIRAEDAQKMVLDLPQPTDPTLVLMTLATSMSGYVIDREAVLAHEQRGDLGNAWLTTHAAGSGAFELEEWRPKELLTMRRAAHHWQPAAKLRRVVFRHMTESQTLRLMLMRGDLDVAGGMSAPDVRALAKRPDLVVEEVRRATMYYVAVNARHPRYADERVRRAVLRHLIDFQGVASGVLPFYGELQMRPVPPGLPASLPQPDYRFDPAAARKLLAEAGLPEGFDTTIRVVAEAPFTGIATSLQATLAQGGIRASILPGTGNQVYGSMRERSFEIVVGRGGGGAEAHPHSSLRALVYNPDNRDSARLSNFQGWRTGYADAALNGLIERALLTPDAAAQADLYRQAQQRFDAQVGAIQPIAQMLDTQVLRRAVRGYHGHPSGATRLREVDKEGR